MLEPGLAIVSAGQRIAGFPCLQTVSSSGLPWRGFLLEKNILPSSDLPSCKVPFSMAGIVFGAKPVRRYWREGGRERELDATYGTLATLPVGESLPQRWGEPLRFMSITFEPSFLHDAVWESVRREGLDFRQEANMKDPTIQNLFFALSSEMEAGCVASGLLGETIAVSLAVALLQKYSDSEIKIRNYERGLSKRTLRLAMDYIHGHLDQELTLAKVAAVAGMSPYYFNNLFALSTGKTLHRYVVEQRLQRGKYLLTFTQGSLSDVALECGFAGQSHFTTTFAKAVGATPKVFRIQTQR
ncbi:MAG: helix-turn-helix transcriptional regulator [Acidobacteriaceae bacterium]|nr:helix-turn-helix transcriptional regulator [Acidobacteriaceae bacterium]